MFSVSGKDKSEVSGIIRSLKRTKVKTSITPTKSREEDDNPTEENDWYGMDMELSEEQAKQLADFVSDKQAYNARDIEGLVARALMHGNKVVINADW